VTVPWYDPGVWHLWLALQVPASAEPVEDPVVLAASTDAEAIRALIDDQIAAFRRHDAEGAWRHVAPELREKFGTADVFLRMVRDGYRPVYAPRSYSFGPLQATPDGLGQWLEIIGPDGERVQAMYLLERQPDGTWRTSGCLLFGGSAEKPAV
jgi:hypothetical protein